MLADSMKSILMNLAYGQSLPKAFVDNVNQGFNIILRENIVFL